MIIKDIFDCVGNTPVVRLSNPPSGDVSLFLKLEGCNPTGSVKDRAAQAILRSKIDQGELVCGKTILDASSGSFACSIAMFGQVLGYPVKVITGNKMTEDKLNFVQYFGADLVSYGKFTIEGNQYCKNEILKTDSERYCFLDQLHNWENPNTHYHTTGPEILRDLPRVSAVVFSLGSGGTLHGISRFLREQERAVSIIAVTADSGTKIPGTGAFVDGDYTTPFIADAEKKNYFDLVVRVNQQQAWEALGVLRAQGIFAGLQTGGVYHGACEAIRQLDLKGDILIISGDTGWKNMDKLMSLHIANGKTSK